MKSCFLRNWTQLSDFVLKANKRVNKYLFLLINTFIFCIFYFFGVHCSFFFLINFTESKTSFLKRQSVTFFWLKMIRNQNLSKYITSQCSTLLPYFSPIHNGQLIIMFSNLSGTGKNSQEIGSCRCIITSRL